MYVHTYVHVYCRNVKCMCILLHSLDQCIEEPSGEGEGIGVGEGCCCPTIQGLERGHRTTDDSIFPQEGGGESSPE